MGSQPLTSWNECTIAWGWSSEHDSWSNTKVLSEIEQSTVDWSKDEWRNFGFDVQNVQKVPNVVIVVV